MPKIFRNSLCLLLFALTTMFSTGCASGGYTLTRQYAEFLNGQRNTVLRVIVYILTSVVFVFTMLIDLIVYNTMDFWDGRVSAGDYQFSQGDRTYYAHHEVLPDSKLKRSTIRVQNTEGKLLQTVMLSETPSHEIEMFVDGVKRCQVRNLSEIPVATYYDAKGEVVATNLIIAPVVAQSSSGVAVF